MLIRIFVANRFPVVMQQPNSKSSQQKSESVITNSRQTHFHVQIQRCRDVSSRNLTLLSRTLLYSADNDASGKVSQGIILGSLSSALGVGFYHWIQPKSMSPGQAYVRPPNQQSIESPISFKCEGGRRSQLEVPHRLFLFLHFFLPFSFSFVSLELPSSQTSLAFITTARRTTKTHSKEKEKEKKGLKEWSVCILSLLLINSDARQAQVPYSVLLSCKIFRTY